MVKKTGCQCFTCRHSDEPRLIAAYLTGYIEASDWFLNWVKRHNIKSGYISDDNLPSIIAQMECNAEESACLLDCMPDIERDENGKN